VLTLALDSLDQPCFNDFHVCAALTRLRSLQESGAASDPRLHQLLDKAEPLLPAMSARNIATVLHGCASLGVELSEGWLDRFWAVSQGKLAELHPQALSNTLWACGQLLLSPPNDWVKGFWAESVGKLGEFTPQALSNTLWACGTLSLTPPEAWRDRFWAESVEKLAQFDPQHLSNTLWACSTLSQTPPEAWCDRFWALSVGKLGEFTPQALSNTLWACGQLLLAPPNDWVKSFWDESVDKLEQFTEQNFSNTLWACGQLSLTPPEAWRDCFWAESVERLAQFNPQALSNTMWACGQLLLSPPKSWQDRYWKCCEVSLPQFNEQALSNALYACCQLQLLQHPVAAKLWSAAMEKLSAPGRAPRDADLCLCQLYHVSKLAEAELPGSCFSFPDAALIERAKAAWHALQSGGSAQAATSFELQVSSCLTRLGVAHQRSFLCTDCEHTIDVAITAGGKRLAIEVDGPTHFLQAPQHTLDGSTQLRNRLLSAHGWTVVSVPHYEWDFLSYE